ncbi:hypothetical protein VKT23_011981 [Stygiomarasmius scandens]|uniref:Uncharacterized protein n=1 Tax=Marasmiellus scandens TaxID=2682957 RepID=A0ABR1JBI3_9AGAR
MSTYSDAAPLKLPRLVTLFFSFAWGVIAGGVAINAKVKSEQQKDDLERLIPPGATLDLDTSDVNSSGIVITVVSLIIAVLSLIYFILVLLSGHTRADSGSSSRRFHVGSVSHLSSRTLPFQWISLSFLAVWLFAVQTPFTSFFANRSAGVRVFIGTIELQPGVIQVIENELGITPVYKHIDYRESIIWLFDGPHLGGGYD